MIASAAAVFGLVIGSVLNVVILRRVPRRRSVVLPTSSCPKCSEPIAPRDNIPLLSYLLLRGRCRNCGPIPVRYSIIEALTALLFAAAGYKFGESVQLISALVLIATLLSLAAIDLEHGPLPKAIIGPRAAVEFVLSVLRAPSGWWIYLLSALAVEGVLLADFLGALSWSVGGGLLLALRRMRRSALPFGEFMGFGSFMSMFGRPVHFKPSLRPVGV